VKSAPKPAPAKPKDLLAERVSQAAEESENAAAFMADKGRRAAVAGAVTTLLPIVAKPPPPPSHKAPLVAAAIVAVGLVAAAVIVLLHGRNAPVTPPVVTAGAGLAASDRASLQACAARWSQSLLARQPASGAEAAQQFASLLRGHTAGASLAADQQLRLLAALDRTRGPRGWGASLGGPVPTAEATSWALVAYAQMAQANHAATALDRVRLAVDSLVAQRRGDGAFADASGRVTDELTATVAWALVEAKRSGVAAPAAEQARAGVVAQATARLVAGSVPAGVDAMTFWVLWQGRPLGTVPSAEAPAVARAFARTLLARCPATRGCEGAPSWEPWTALALTELLRDPPASLDAPTRQSLAALRALTIGRVGASREVIARAPTAAVATWLFAAAELQR